MKLLSKRDYLQLMVPSAVEVTPGGEAMRRVLQYAVGVWSELDLKPRKLAAKDLVATYRHGDRWFFHVKAFPRRMPDTFVIVIADEQGQNVQGHILIDLAAEYARPVLDCPCFDFTGEIGEAEIRNMIPQIDPSDDNPFAILSLGKGTYMQTLRTEDGYVLEHQLVNTSSHYEIPDLASSEEVTAAMLSYGFGGNEWLEMFPWRRQKLN